MTLLVQAYIWLKLLDLLGVLRMLFTGRLGALSDYALTFTGL